MPYWDDRRKKLDAGLAKSEKQLFQRLQKFYSTEAARLDKEIAAYYAKYGENNVISYRHLMEQLSDADRRLLIEDMQSFATAYPQYAHLLPVRESIYKLNRLEGLRTSIAIQQLHIGAKEQAEAKAFFEQLALRYANAAAEQMGFGSSFYRLDHEMLRLVVGNKWCNGKDFSERIWSNRTALTQALQNEVTNAFIRGDDLKKTSRILHQKFTNVSQKNIERLVFTENSYLANEASIRVFEQEPNIQKYQFLATNDARTCEICMELNEQVFKISERSAGVNFPPMHPWCRCFALPVWEDEKGAQRGLTNGADGGTISVGRKMSAPLQEPPDFSQFDVRVDTEAVEQIRQTISETLGIDLDKIKLDGIQNTQALEPFVNRMHRIQEDTAMRFPGITAVEVIDGDPCCIADYKPYEGVLYISSRFFNSREALESTLREWAKNDILPKQAKSIAYLAEHETAHIRIPDELLQSAEAQKIWKRRKLDNKNDNISIFEYYADAVAIYRMNKNIPDKNILDAIEYLRKGGVVV